MEQKQRFVILANTGRFYFGELCEQFGISRKTGYKYLGRYADGGIKALEERSHRPHNSPRRTDEGLEALILAERRLHCTWGPKKLQAVLQAKHGIESPPAQSTIGGMLRRHGLSARPRRKPGSYEPINSGLTEPTQPNHVWTVDFKGWFVLGDGRRCDPLTVCDRYSRYLLACRAQPNQQYKKTLESFKSLMRHHGLPWIIRVDNGAPFASCGNAGAQRRRVSLPEPRRCALSSWARPLASPPGRCFWKWRCGTDASRAAAMPPRLRNWCECWRHRNAMLAFPSTIKIYLAVAPVDMRKQFNGLWSCAHNQLKADPRQGAVFVFANKKRDRVKLLYWDGTGVWVLAKRLEKGRFSWPTGSDPARLALTPEALTMLLAGIDLREGVRKAWYESR